MAMISRFLNKANKHLKSRRALGVLAIAVGYILMVDVNLQERARMLQEQRALSFRELITIDKGEGVCDIRSPTEDGKPIHVDDGTLTTLLVSYPGSGKRFTWTIIKALTNSEVADDWNFSGKLKHGADAPLTVKTSWPHKEGIWSWEEMMDQVIFLVRDPSRAIPSYHNMRFELDYAEDWASSYTNIPMTYKERPPVQKWEDWRDEHFEIEMDQWIYMIEFWVRGGYDNSTESVHKNCGVILDCKPKAIIDFDHFYQPGANSDFIQLCKVLEESIQDSESVKMISSQIRACVLSQVFENPELHQGGRPDTATDYTFTLSQFDDMLRKVTELRDRVQSAITPVFDPDTHYEETTALELVTILNKYIDDISAKRYLLTEIVVEQAAARAFGTSTCTEIDAGTSERESCDYMTTMASHNGVLDSAYSKESFPYEDYLLERADLVRFYNNNGGTDWANREGWLGEDDHCTWANIICNEDHRIKSMSG